MKTKTDIKHKSVRFVPVKNRFKTTTTKKNDGEKSYTESNKSNKYSNNSNTRKTPTTIREGKNDVFKAQIPTVVNHYKRLYFLLYPFSIQIFSFLHQIAAKCFITLIVRSLFFSL